MPSFLKAFAKEGAVSFLALLVLLAIIWFGGEYLEIERGLRILAIVLVLGAWLVLYVLQRAMAVRSAMLIEKRLRAQAAEQIATVRPDKRPEVEALEAQLSEAIQSLKASSLGRGALYALPWYVIIGPPGVGKTTALLESGLNFPFTSQGRKGLRGIGGTRNCDWWFTDQGILLDTAGRYTTELEDRDEWLSFLDLLKRYRRRKPINGAIVAVSVADVLKATDEELESHATNIRNRLDELVRRLELVFPVYLVFTKCDLLQGFVEFFEDFARSDRMQAWGATFPYAASAAMGPRGKGPPGKDPHGKGLPPQGSPLQGVTLQDAAAKCAAGEGYRQIFQEKMRGLYGALGARRLATLSKERPEGKRNRVYTFPLQFALAERRLGELVELLFRPNPFQESAVFRGFYFTSGTQEGAPLDQVLTAMSGAFDLKAEGAELASQTVERKSYFINELFTKVVFPDHVLARSSTRVERRARLVRKGCLIGSLAASAILLSFLLLSFFRNAATISSVADAAVAVHERRGVPANPAEDLPLLEDLRREVALLDRYGREGPPLGLRWGLYAGDRIDERARAVYFDRLRRLLVEPCDAVMHSELERRRIQKDKTFAQYDELYEIHRVYQKLAGNDRVRPPIDELRRVLIDRHLWLPPKASLEDREGSERIDRLATAQLDFYLSQLERPDATRFALDKELVDRINRELSDTLWITQSFQDVYNNLADRLQRVTRDTLLEGRGKGLFVVDHEFSSFYTQEGWDLHVKSAIAEKSKRLSEKYAEVGIQSSAAEIESRLRDTYLNGYRTQWLSFLEKVSLDPEKLKSLQAAHSSLEALVGPESPYDELFRKVWAGQAIRFSEGEQPRNQVVSDFQWLEAAIKALGELKEALGFFIGRTRAGQRVLVDRRINEHLGPLVAAFQKAYGGVSDAVNGIADVRHRQLARDIIVNAINGARRALLGESQEEVNGLWGSSVHAFFAEKAAGRYPFVEDAEEQVSLADFSRVFNPKTGILWTARQVLRDLEALNIASEPLVAYSLDFEAAMRRAQAITAALYAPEEETISVPFEITLKQREGVQRIEISLGDAKFDFYDRPDHRGKLTWLENKSEGAKLSIRVGENQWRVKDHSKEPWGLLRLFREGMGGSRVSAGDAKAFSLNWTFTADVRGKEQVFAVDADVRLERENPFRPHFFEEFQCPEKVRP